MKRVKFLGASGTVTGSSYVVLQEGRKGLMVDCGMFQGPEHISKLNFDPSDFNPAELEDVILTHAHLDHCGRLPILTNNGFRGNIYMTKATRDLLSIVLFDSARIAANDEDKTPLYDEDDVAVLLSHTKVVNYHEEFEAGGYKVTMHDAGHILGSASLEITDRHANDGVNKLIFSGDLGNSPQAILQSFEKIAEGEVVIMESTYGGKTHPEDDATSMIQSEINTIEESGGTLLIPSFSIQRTQEILLKLRNLKAEGKIQSGIPVFLDSPMAIKVTDVYKSNKDVQGEQFKQNYQNEDPFMFPGLKKLEKSFEGRVIRKTHGPKVIIAGSGMMTGGRIVKHARHYLKSDKTRLLIVGYQGEETLGKDITEGMNPVKIMEEDIQVKASITQIRSMSAHADEPKLLEWLTSIYGVKKVILTHGDDQPRVDLAHAVKETVGVDDVLVPLLNEEHAIGYA